MEMQRGPWEDYARPATPRIVVPTQAPPRTPDQARIERGNAEAAPLAAPPIRALEPGDVADRGTDVDHDSPLPIISNLNCPFAD